MWDKILQSGRRITAVASSDSHRPDTPIGKPTTHVAASDLTQPAILKAIRMGHVYLSDGSARVELSFEGELANGTSRSRAMIGDQLRLLAPGKVRFLITTQAAPANATVSLISNGGVVRSFPANADGNPQIIEMDCQHDAYFRLEVRDGTKSMLALTNPIYIKIRPSR
jgi:hypothetical protein